jgi:hypothetical protein
VTEAEIRAYLATPEFEARCYELIERLDSGSLSDEESAAVLGVPVEFFQYALAEQAKKWSTSSGSSA